MAFRARPQFVNPRLGAYFGIFAATLVGIVVMMLIFEQLGTNPRTLRRFMLLGLLSLFTAIGIAAYTVKPAEFLLSGRRVPASFNGLALALAALGGTGLAAGTGALFIAGFDALALPLGLIAGLVVMAVLFTPFIRKFGAPTLPSFLGMRLDSPTVRLAASGAAAISLLFILIAEVKVAAFAASWLTQGSERTAAWLVVVALLTMLIPGGIRSLSWTTAAQAIAALFAVLVPLAIVAVMETNLPLGQLSHGPVLRTIGRIEAVQGIGSPVATLLQFELPGIGLQPISGRFATPFSVIGPIAYALAILAIMAGTAASPMILTRVATAPTVYEARKSIGWTVVIAGILVMTMSAVAVFMRDKLMHEFLAAPPDRWPAMLKPLIDLGLAGLDGQARAGAPNAFLFRRDGVILALGVQQGFPLVLVHLLAIGILAAALAAAGSSLTQLGLIVGEDVVAPNGSALRRSPWRLHLVRGSMALVALVAGLMAAHLPGDPLDLVLWAAAVSGSTLFPVLMLAIWWKRTNAWGALAGFAAGLGIVVAGLLTNATDVVTLAPILLPTLAAPVAIMVTISVSKATPPPTRHMLEMVRDLRVPGGETVYDREMRLAAQRERQQQTP